MRTFRAVLAGMFVSCALPLVASALTADDINAQIAALLKQVAALQAQLAQLNASSGASSSPDAAVSASLATNAACPRFTHSLARGARGDDVRSLQTFLASRNFLGSDAVSGAFDAQTESALQAAQAKYNIVASGAPATTGWGVLGPRTIRMIALNCTIAPSSPVPQNNVAPNSSLPRAADPSAGVAISGVDAPNVLVIGQTGTWLVRASAPNNSALSVSALWGDEATNTPTSGAIINSSATFIHAYQTTGTYTPTFTVSNGSVSAKVSASVTVTAPSIACPVFQLAACPAGQHYVSDGTTYDANNCPIPRQHCVADVVASPICLATTYPMPPCAANQHAVSPFVNGCPAAPYCANN